MSLLNNSINLKLGLQNVEIVVLDRFPPSHPLTLWTFVGLVALFHCGIGITLLVLNIARKYFDECVNRCALTVKRFKIFIGYLNYSCFHLCQTNFFKEYVNGRNKNCPSRPML